MLPAAAPGRLTRFAVTLFLCGDVMSGRGLDQILPHSVKPRIYEPYVKDARDYVRLAEEQTGPMPDRVDYAYPWGDALAILNEVAPQARLINLETAVTADGEPWPGKGIQYRMHPENVGLLTRAGIDVAVLANNHVLDWGYPGLEATLQTLHRAGIHSVGAGRDGDQAQAPAVLELAAGQRLLIFAFAVASSGVPGGWAATAKRAGVALLPDLSEATVHTIAKHIAQFRQDGDWVVVSLHWGDNWGYRIPAVQQRFAHALVDKARVDLIYGHSSHHPRPLEVYQDRLILYGCGDFINDYEGISGHEEYRPELALMYFPGLEERTGRLQQLRMVPLRRHQFRLQRTKPREARWLADLFNRIGKDFGSAVWLAEDGSLLLQWH